MMSPDTGVGDDERDGVETGEGRDASCPTRLGLADALEAVAAVASTSIGDSTYIWVSESGETIIGGGFASTEGTAFPSL